MDLAWRGSGSGGAVHTAGVETESGVVDELAGTVVLLLGGAVVSNTVGSVVGTSVLVVA